MRFIALGANNRFRSITSQTFAWLPDGPIQRHFRQYIESDFFKSGFNEDLELMIQVIGTLSKSSSMALMARLKRLEAGQRRDAQTQARQVHLRAHRHQRSHWRPLAEVAP
ncbi:MAG: hypothetical protein ACREVG_08855 [Burkholderiales bacterium]